MQSAKPTVWASDGDTRTPPPHGLSQRWRHEDAAPSRYNHGVEPAMATRGGRRPRFEPRSRHEDAAGHSALTLRKVRADLELRHESLHHGVGTTIATRGGCRTQHANSAQGAGRHRVTTPSQNRKKGRGWHTNREGGRSVLVSHLAILCRDPNRFEPAIATRGGLPTTTRIQSEAQDRVTGSFSNGRVPYTGLDTTA